MTANHRPLSPHLQVYRLPLTGMISISHRITGVFLSLTLLLFVYLLYAITAGETSYLAMQNFMALRPCRLVYWGGVYALLFHACHGIRHLLWDVGKTFDRAKLNAYAVLEILVSVALTVLIYLMA